MDCERQRSCCFTGHRPAKLPWGHDERDPRCLALKRSIAAEVEKLYRQGFRRFFCGMALGCDLYFAEAVLEFKERYPAALLAAVLPFPQQAGRWSASQRQRWQDILARCDECTVVQDSYDPYCMLRRDRWMAERSAAVLAVFDGSAGGTRYTLDCAAKNRLSIRILDPNRPELPARRLDFPEESYIQENFFEENH